MITEEIRKYCPVRPGDPVHHLFSGWEETIIWSCLEGRMGEIFTDLAEESALAVLSGFVFLAGKPSAALLSFDEPRREASFKLLIPQNTGWAELIERFYGSRIRKFTRYAMKKEPEVFDIPKLEQAAARIPKGYEIRQMQKPEYRQCLANQWSEDLVLQFPGYDNFRKNSLGFAALYNGEVISGAAAYSRYQDGIEIEIDTREDHQRKGLARACSAALILECLKRGLYPSWDAHNLSSEALAEKLGYHLDYAYTAYEVMNISDQ